MLNGNSFKYVIAIHKRIAIRDWVLKPLEGPEGSTRRIS